MLLLGGARGKGEGENENKPEKTGCPMTTHASDPLNPPIPGVKCRCHSLARRGEATIASALY